MSRSDKVPRRKCIGCGLVGPRTGMMRIIVDGEQGAVLDVKMRLGGRGAYLCRNRVCVENALSRGLLARALRRPLFSGTVSDGSSGAVFLAAVRGEVDGQARL